MFTNLRLGRFKSWRDTGDIRLAPITCFLGTNSSGKTSLLQSLLLLRQTTESPDRNRVLDLSTPNGTVDLGTFQDILFNHDESAPISFGVDWTSGEPFVVRDLLRQAQKQSSALISSEKLGLDVSISVRKNQAEVERLAYRLGDASFSMSRTDRDKYDLISQHYGFVRSQGRAWPLPKPARFYGFPDQVRLYYQNAGFLTELELAFENACSRLKYLGPLREDPKRQYIFSGGAPGDVGRRGEFAVDALIASRVARSMSSRGFVRNGKRRTRKIPTEQLVAEWLQELGLIHSFDLESLDDRETVYRVRIRRTRNSIPVLITDVGFGVSQVLPVLVLLAYAAPGDTVVLEQPEIHLHPAVQGQLADVIIEASMVRNVQVVIETHSEHLLTRLQRRIAEHDLDRGVVLTPSDVALYFCAQHEAESRISALEVDLFGNIRNWPADFFGNPLEDSVAMVRAAAKRSEQMAS